MIDFGLYKNHLTNGNDYFRAIVQPKGTIQLEGITERMVQHGSTLTSQDISASLDEFFKTSFLLLLEGYNVNTPAFHMSLSIRGNFEGPMDTYDPTRHQLVILIKPTRSFQRDLQVKAQVRQQETNVPVPKPLKYFNPNNGDLNDTLTPGGGATLHGHRLQVEPDDPDQGIFLVPADESPTRVEVILRNTDRELIFLVPGDLPAGEYQVQVRARFGNETIRTGTYEQLLVVP